MEEKLDGKNLDALVNKCLEFADRNGRVLDKGSSSFSSYLRMDYQDNKLQIRFSAQCSPFSNGSVSLNVHWDGSAVFDATGNFTAMAHGTKVTRYVPGDWEKTVGYKK